MISNTDHRLLSFCRIAAVSRYSDYYMLISFIRQMLVRIFMSVRPSAGNLDITGSRTAVGNFWYAMGIFQLVVCAVAGDGLLLTEYFRRPEFNIIFP